VGNALKFTPAGGAVTLGVERVEGLVRFTVADTGPGIPAEELPHIFDRFWKSRQPGAAHATGLGLSIVKGLAEAHGGTVSVESRPGAGSVFRLALPLAPSDGSAVPNPPARPLRLAWRARSSRTAS
jgi:signal transduction histidine kinase